GLSPKENREVPPLDYPLVHAMKKSFSDLEIVINGGIKTLDDSLAQLEHVDGVMLGRAAYQTPYVLAEADQRIFGADRPVPTRHQVAEQFCGYIDEQVGAGVPAYAMLRHVLGLFQGQRGARAFRRHIAENGTKPGAGAQVLRDAIAKVPEQEQRRAA
ncbi:MAG: tRNA-dihydrouridine synthase, partial [Deltaproteobacteria bacterium]|nr:tRNA-dihydrouridine synthase [Deltaproteobacteria bacterium]